MLKIFLSGNYKEILEEKSSLRTELYLNLLLKQLRPAIIIEYTRIAFRDKLSNTSITLDRDIKSIKNCNKFFSKIDSAPNKKYILEIKYDNYVPEYIKNIVISIDSKKVTRAKFVSQISKYNWN